MKTWEASLLCKKELMLGEAAHWHAAWQQFLYVDIEHGVVGCIDHTTNECIERNVGKKIGTVVPAGGSKLLVALQSSIEELDFEKGTLTHLSDIESYKPENRCNDGKCDAAGRLWIGTMHENAKPHEGALYRYDTGLTKMLDGTSISNGVCWSTDNKTMYYIDSFERTIKAFDFDVSRGAISNGRTVVVIDVAGCLPDGMCIDCEGMLWVAVWGAGYVGRYDPLSGSLIAKVNVDAPQVSSCCFGGKDMRQMFITTAAKGMAQAELATHSLSGSLFIVDLPFKGPPSHSYRFL